MNVRSENSDAKTNLVNAFRAYLQTVITAKQFGQSARLSALPGAKTANYCVALAKLEDNTLARELAAPVWAILKEIDKATMDFHRPLYHKQIKDAKTLAEYEKILWQLDFALALIQRELSVMVQFRAKRTKCSDLLCNRIVEMNDSAETVNLILKWQKEFSQDDGDADGSIPPESLPHDFAWDTYLRVEALNDLADKFPDHIKTAARQMHGWPMLVHRHTTNRKRFQELATRLELGTEYPLDATDAARFRPDTPLVRYLDPLIFKLVFVWNLTADETYKTAEEESESLRLWWSEGQDERAGEEEIAVARKLRKLPRLTKATANEWAEKAVVPAIMIGDARDWKNCEEPVLQRLAKQKGVKSRATFKSRLLSAVSATLRRLARST